MPAAEVELPKLQNLAGQLLSTAEHQCGVIEQGTEVGFSRSFRSLACALRAPELAAGLVGITPESLLQAARWLFGSEAADLIVELSRRYFVVEVQWGGAGAYRLAAAGSVECEYASLGALASAIAPLAGGAPETLATLVLPEAQSGRTSVLVTALLEQALGSRTASSRLLSIHALLLAGDPVPAPDAFCRSVEEVLGAIDLVQPVLTSAPDEGGTGSAWWRGMGFSVRPLFLSPIILRAEEASGQDGVTPAAEEEASALAAPPDRPRMLVDGNDSLRQSLLLVRLAGKMQIACDSVAPYVVDQTQELNKRQQPLRNRERELDEKAKGKGDAKVELEYVKGLLEELLPRTVQNIDDINQKLMQPKGQFPTLVRQLVDSINADDFEDIPGVKTIRRSLHGEFHKRSLSSISQSLRQQMKDDVQKLLETVEHLNKEIDAVLQRVGGEPIHFEVPRLEEVQVWQHVKGELFIDSRCEIEQQRKSVVTALAAARKLLMPFFMTLSMVGFGNVKNSLGQPLLIGIFVAAIAMAIWEANKEAEEKFDKELEKIKDTVTQELTKVVANIQKEKSNRINLYITELKRGMVKKLEEQLRLAAEQRSVELERERAAVKGKTRLVDTRIKELQDAVKVYEKVQQGGKEIETSARKILTECALADAKPARTTTLASSKAAPVAAPTRASVRAAAAVPKAEPAPAAVAVEEPMSAAAMAVAAATASAAVLDAPPAAEEEKPQKPSAVSRMAALRASLRK